MIRSSLDAPGDEPGTGTTTPAEPALPARRAGVRTVARRRRLGTTAAPYLLVAPTLVILAAVLAYPLSSLARLSFEQYGLRELIQGHGTWIGIDNYRALLGDAEFWRVVVRTVLFTAANVVLTILFGTLIALLMEQVGRVMRLLLTFALIFVWAVPFIVAVDVWQWMVDYEFGVVNWTLTELHLGNFIHHNWFADPLQGFAVVTAVVVWGAIPFVAITLFAGLAQVPPELLEAARVDGAGPWPVFRHITFQLLKPLFIIVTSLSIIWDFQVFNQVWVMLGERPPSDYYLLSIYAFSTSFGIHQYGRGAAIAVVMVLLLVAVTFFYIRQMVRIGEAS